MNYKLFIDKIRLALQKRSKMTQNKKSYAGWLSRGYCNDPSVSFIIESHNKSLQVMHIVEKLRKYPSAEIIVIDDGSDKEHTHRLAEGLTGGSEFLIRANDLYENVMYNKSIRFANANIIALLQDDDDFDSLDWVDEAVRLFRENPEMVILGGCEGVDVTFDHEKGIAHGAPYTHPDHFCFVPTVNRAPMWINKSLFTEHLHDIDFNYAPFQMDDYELCLRAWQKGLKVGWYDAHFHSLSVGGMRLWNNAFTQEQYQRNGRQLYATYKDQMAEIYENIKFRVGS